MEKNGGPADAGVVGSAGGSAGGSAVLRGEEVGNGTVGSSFSVEKPGVGSLPEDGCQAFGRESEMEKRWVA